MPLESAQNRGYFAPQGYLPTPGLRVASDRPTGGAYGWLKSAAGRATLRTRKSLIRLDFIEHKSERSGMPQDTGVGRNVVLDFASLRRVWEQAFGAAPPHSLSRVFLCRVLAYERQCRTHGGLSVWPPWRTGHQATALPQSPFLPAPISSASGMAGPRPVPKLAPLEMTTNQQLRRPRTNPPTTWAAGRARAADCAPGSPSLDWTLSSTRANVR